MEPPKDALVLVLGGTGVQGSSVVEHLLSDAHAWRIRVPTRSPDSDAASKLKARGVEVVQADLLSPEDVKAVMAGAWAVFGVTLPTFDPATSNEQEQGIMMAEVARAAGVQVYVWSSLPDIERLSGGKLPHVYFFSMKAKVWEAVQRMGFPVACAVEVGAYFSNFRNHPLLSTVIAQSDGAVELSMLRLGADDKLLCCDVTELGLVVAAILHKPEPLNGKRIGFTTTFNQPISKYREGLQRVIGKPVRLQVRQGDDVPAPLVEMMEWYQEWGFWGEPEENIVDAQSLVQQRLTDWEGWMVKDGWKARFS